MKLVKAIGLFLISLAVFPIWSYVAPVFLWELFILLFLGLVIFYLVP